MSVKELFNWIEAFNVNVKRNDDETTKGYISRLLNKYQQDLSDMPCPINSRSDWDNLLNDVQKANSTIIECLDLYSRAHLAESIEKFHELLIQGKVFLTLEVKPEVKDDKNWYRMRKQDEDERVFPAKKMFHIPFNLRSKVSLARYSISGYPCLYISRSVWATWEEMHEPKLSDFAVSRLELQRSFNVLDLRVPVWRENIDEQRLLCQLYTIPLVIACSIKVKYPKDNFKPEYIIPQLVMLAIAYQDVDYIGCAYTSTMRNPVFKWSNMNLLDNIALPVKLVDENQELCPKLCAYFKITDSTNYDFELFKEPFETEFWMNIDKNGVHDEAKEYQNSVFGQLESRLKQMECQSLL